MELLETHRTYMKYNQNLWKCTKLIEHHWMYEPSMQIIEIIQKYIKIYKNQWQPMFMHANHYIIHVIYTIQLTIYETFMKIKEQFMRFIENQWQS